MKHPNNGTMLSNKKNKSAGTHSNMGECIVLSARSQAQKSTHSVAFWKRGSYRDNERIGCCLDLGVRDELMTKGHDRTFGADRDALDFCGSCMSMHFFQSCALKRVDFTVYEL